MRKDQVNLKKQFDALNESILLKDRQIKHRERVIDYLSEQIKDLEQGLLIQRINHWRAVVGQPLLTKLALDKTR